MNDTGTIRILIVDDHPMVRTGLRDFILAFDGMETVGEAQNGVEAVNFCAANDVDVILMDMVMPLMDGGEATQRIMGMGKPVKVVALTSFHERDLIQRAMKAGATSYLLKNTSAADLVEAIRAAHGGYSMLSPEAAEGLLRAENGKPATSAVFSDREKEILTLLVKGETNLEISGHLFISQATVKYHLANVFSKMGVKNRVEAVAYALEHGLLGQ